MEPHNQTCPVCDSPIKNGSIEFCQTCNLELLVIAENASKELKQYLENKIKLHKKIFSQTHLLREDISSKNQAIESLEKEKEELAAKVKTLDSEFTKKSDEFQKIKAKADDTEDKQKKIKELESKISLLEVEVERIKKDKLFPPI